MHTNYEQKTRHRHHNHGDVLCAPNVDILVCNKLDGSDGVYFDRIERRFVSILHIQFMRNKLLYLIGLSLDSPSLAVRSFSGASSSTFPTQLNWRHVHLLSNFFGFFLSVLRVQQP